MQIYEGVIMNRLSFIHPWKHPLYTKCIENAANVNIPWEQLNNKQILITGVSGMIASTLVDILMYRNMECGQTIQITGVSRNMKKIEERFEIYQGHKEVKFYAQDITQHLPEMGQADYLIHAASNTHPKAYATDPIGTITANVNGTYELLEYATKHNCQRFLFCSSVEIYGENRGDTEYFGEDYLGYIDCNTTRAGYSESKRLGEALCNAYGSQKNQDFVIARLSRVYGPTMGQEDSKAIAQFIKKAAAGENIVLKSKGDQLYSYTYVVDAALALLYLLIYGNNGDAVNISDRNSEITLLGLTQILAKTAGVQTIREIPEETERAGYSTATKAILKSDKIEAYGWSAQTSIQDGLYKTAVILKDCITGG